MARILITCPVCLQVGSVMYGCLPWWKFGHFAQACALSYSERCSILNALMSVSWRCPFVPGNCTVRLFLPSGHCITSFTTARVEDVIVLSLALANITGTRLSVPRLCVHLFWPPCFLASSTGQFVADVHCLLSPIDRSAFNIWEVDHCCCSCGDPCVDVYDLHVENPEALAEWNCMHCGPCSLCPNCHIQVDGGWSCFGCVHRCAGVQWSADSWERCRLISTKPWPPDPDDDSVAARDRIGYVGYHCTCLFTCRTIDLTNYNNWMYTYLDVNIMPHLNGLLFSDRNLQVHAVMVPWCCAAVLSRPGLKHVSVCTPSWERCGAPSRMGHQLTSDKYSYFQVWWSIL